MLSCSLLDTGLVLHLVQLQGGVLVVVQGVVSLSMAAYRLMESNIIWMDGVEYNMIWINGMDGWMNGWMNGRKKDS